MKTDSIKVLSIFLATGLGLLVFLFVIALRSDSLKGGATSPLSETEPLADRIDEALGRLDTQNSAFVSASNWHHLDLRRRARALDVQGIAWTAHMPLAFVNNEVIGVGDTMLGFQVVAIQKDQITFQDKKGNKVSVSVPRGPY